MAKQNSEAYKTYRSSQKFRDTRKRYREKLREEALKILGNKCCFCGFKDIRCLQVDHIDGGGGKEVKKLGHQGIYLKIRQGNIKEYQLLCANCNWIKRVEKNETCQRK